EDAQDDFLLRFLSLFESFFEEPENAIAQLPALFDPAAAPSAALGWLAGWLALDLAEDLTDAQKRLAITRAFDRYARRGTAQGLRGAGLEDAGGRAVVDEPIRNAGWWRLPSQSKCPAPGGPQWIDGENSTLGFTTALVSASPGGAVLGAGAVLDQSQLIA